MSEDCPHCVFEKTEANCRGCFEGSHYKPKPLTNADRIRAMTDEELAEFIAYSTSCETCVVRKGGSDECHNTNCSTAWLGWMKQEATNA